MQDKIMFNETISNQLAFLNAHSINQQKINIKYYVNFFRSFLDKLD